jgi:hypothetical protein
MNRIT